MIEKVEGRRGVITRGYRHRQHVIAANVDTVLIVSALAEPGLKLSLIDRYLLAAEIGGVRPVIVLNKADLVDLALYQWVVGLYIQLGYETMVTSASRRPRDRSAPRTAGGRRHGPLGPERCRQELAAECDPARAEPEGPRGLGLDDQGEAHHDRPPS